MTDWHPDADELVGLALAEATATDQERLLAHLSSCPSCHEQYAGLIDGVQRALAATPAVAPPAGFSGRVLAGMGAPETVPDANAGRRWPRWSVLVAAAIGVVVGVGATLGTVAAMNRPPATSTQLQPVAASLVTGAGDEVGSVGLTTQAGRRYVLLNITVGKPDVRYECILIGKDGTRTSGGTWTLTDEYPTGSASGSWLVPFSGDPPVAVEMVTPTGTVWARATF